MDRPPLPTYEELFLTPPKSRCQSSFDVTSGFPASPSIDSSTPRLKAASSFDASSVNRTNSDSISDGSDISLVKDACLSVSRSDSRIDASDSNLENSHPDISKEDAADASISVRERAKKLNKLQSESELLPSRRTASMLSTPDLQRPGARRSVAASSEAASIPVHLTKELRKWMVLSSTTNYHPIAKMISENKGLVHFKDFVTGYTPLHWAAKAGQVTRKLSGLVAIF